MFGVAFSNGLSHLLYQQHEVAVEFAGIILQNGTCIIMNVICTVCWPQLQLNRSVCAVATLLANFGTLFETAGFGRTLHRASSNLRRHSGVS